MICIGIFCLSSIISFLIFSTANIARNLIQRNLREVQMNDCQGYNEEIIGKKKYFFRNFFVKSSRKENLNFFQDVIDGPPNLMNVILDEQRLGERKIII